MKPTNRIYVMELVRAYQCGQISRRDFLRQATAAFGSTAAAALLPACRQPAAGTPPPVVVTPSPTVMSPAATVGPAPRTTAATTPTAGVEARTVEYPDPDGETLMGYLALPVESYRPEAASDAWQRARLAPAVSPGLTSPGVAAGQLTPI